MSNQLGNISEQEQNFEFKIEHTQDFEIDETKQKNPIEQNKDKTKDIIIDIPKEPTSISINSNKQKESAPSDSLMGESTIVNITM